MKAPSVPIGRQRGLALLLVLWLLVLLIAVVGVFAFGARVEAMQGTTLRDSSAGGQLARAGLEFALLRVGDPDPGSRWAADGREYAWSFEGVPLRVRILDESGKVDLNHAEPQMLSALLQALGEEPGRAQALAAALVDWRDADALSQPSGGAEDPDYVRAGMPWGAKDAPFETLGEVVQVLGWTPQLYARAAPHLTLYGGRSRPDQAFATGPVLLALGLDPVQVEMQRTQDDATQAAGTGTYSVESRALLADGRQAVLHAVVRMGAGPMPGSVYTTLGWEESWGRR